MRLKNPETAHYLVLGSSMGQLIRELKLKKKSRSVHVNG
jgi:hypothetical protein